MQEAFNKFLEKNPTAYPEFCRRVDQLIKRGIRHYSADSIVHILRYHSAIDERPEFKYKINNNHVRFFARKWQEEHKEFAGFFESRVSRSE